MAYSTTASLDKLTCTDYVDFGKSSDRFGPFFWTKNDSNYLDNMDNRLKVFKKEDKMQKFDWDKTFYWEELLSVSLLDREIN